MVTFPNMSFKVFDQSQVKVDSTNDCTFCASKLSMLHGFTKGVSVDILYL